MADGDIDLNSFPPELQASIRATHAALQKQWEHNKIDARTSYTITIPEQTLCLYGELPAKHAVRTLKSIGVKGTYRITKGNDHEGNRADGAGVAKDQANPRDQWR